jgi:hypothetical protein
MPSLYLQSMSQRFYDRVPQGPCIQPIKALKLVEELELAAAASVPNADRVAYR